MLEGIVGFLREDVLEFLQNHILFIIFILVAWIIVVFNKFIDSLVMKHDKVWMRWYHSKYRCPKCHKKLKPYEVPPNYYCKKCAQIYAFGDQPVKDWLKNKPFMTRGELIRRSMLLIILSMSLLYLFYTFWPLIENV